MAKRADFDKIELLLVRVLHTLITERSVSRAALRLHSTQPAVSAQLKRLRELTGDPLLVRAGNDMTPTETALQLVGPAANLLHEAERAKFARLHDQSSLEVMRRRQESARAIVAYAVTGSDRRISPEKTATLAQLQTSME